MPITNLQLLRTYLFQLRIDPPVVLEPSLIELYLEVLLSIDLLQVFDFHLEKLGFRIDRRILVLLIVEIPLDQLIFEIVIHLEKSIDVLLQLPVLLLQRAVFSFKASDEPVSPRPPVLLDLGSVFLCPAGRRCSFILLIFEFEFEFLQQIYGFVNAAAHVQTFLCSEEIKFKLGIYNLCDLQAYHSSLLMNHRQSNVLQCSIHYPSSVAPLVAQKIAPYLLGTILQGVIIYHNKYKLMQKSSSPSSKNELPTSAKADNQKQFPNIQFRKLSLHTSEHPKYLIKFSKMISNQSNTQPITLSEKERPVEQAVFSLPKNNSFIKKRIFITPNKYSSKQKVQELLENDLVKRQIEELQTNQTVGRDQVVFNSALKEFGLIGGEDFNVNFRTNVNTKQYQAYRKRNAQKQKDKLKPIISQTHINSNLHGLEFFNVGKMNLLDGEKNKKSTSLLVRSYGEQNQHDNIAKFMKEGHSIKERLISKNGLIFQPRDNAEQIKMQTMSPRHNFLEAEHSLHIHRIDTEQGHRTQGETVLHLTRISPQNQKKLPSTQKNSPIRRNNKRFTIPFETYYYRDLIWKVNYTNQRMVEIPQEYEHRLKVFVGKGNNSCMVSGLIIRRPWFAFTDKTEEANFVWTQLKQLSYLKRQDPFKGEINLQQRDKAKYKGESFLTDIDTHNFKSYFKTHFNSQQHNDERLFSRSRYLKYRQFIKATQIEQCKVHNHLINNYILGNKKALFNTMANYYKEMGQNVFDFLPLTFHIKDGLEDKKYFQFLRYYHKRAKEITKANQEKGHVKEYNAWIVKPGENSNRGNGIKMCLTLDQIKSILKKREKYPDGSYRTLIVQAYIQRPLLYYKRKFDLRHYIMMTSINGIIKGYWYKHGYVRTTSTEYTLSQNTGSIHLTNDAVQKNLPEYGKYEKGNKISYEELSTYIEKCYPRKDRTFEGYIYPKMKKMATDAMRASSGGIDPAKLQNNFEIFGMDFMIDANLQVWLIEINTNPCLELSCPLLGCIIPKMVENALELTLDALFPPPVRFCPKGMHYYKQLEKQNKFELVYDERVERLYTGSLQVLDSKLLEEEDDTFEDCGEQWEDK